MKAKTDTIEFAAADIATACKIAKAHGKAQLDNALQFATWLVNGIDWQELIRRAFVEIGQTRRDAGGMIGNASKFIAPARLVLDGRMTKGEYMALKTAEASAAFKAAGGMAGDGLDPDAWLEARAAIAAEASKPKAERVKVETPETPNGAKVTALEAITASFQARKSDLTAADCDKLIEMIKAHRAAL